MDEIIVERDVAAFGGICRPFRARIDRLQHMAVIDSNVAVGEHFLDLVIDRRNREDGRVMRVIDQLAPRRPLLRALSSVMKVIFNGAPAHFISPAGRPNRPTPPVSMKRSIAVLDALAYSGPA